MSQLVDSNVITISSREVAEMMGIRHSDLLEKIDKVNKDFENGKIRSQKYWIEGTYKVVGNNKIYREFQVTKRGCEFLAHKSTGTKGNLFTDKYMDRFEQMEKMLTPSYMIEDPIERAKQWIKEQEEKKLLEEQKEQLQLELDESKDYYSIKRVAFINNISWKYCDWRKLKRESNIQGRDVVKIFDANYGEVNTYHRSVWETIYPELSLNEFKEGK